MKCGISVLVCGECMMLDVCVHVRVRVHVRACAFGCVCVCVCMRVYGTVCLSGSFDYRLLVRVSTGVLKVTPGYE